MKDRESMKLCGSNKLETGILMFIQKAEKVLDLMKQSFKIKISHSMTECVNDKITNAHHV